MKPDLKTIEGLKVFCKGIRNFKLQDVFNAKIKAINEFFLTEKLDTAILGLSGGIDSALVYYLLLHAATEKNSPIKKVGGLFMPINAKGITGQSDAQRHYQDLILNMPPVYKDKANFKIVDLSKVAYEYYKTLMPDTEWVCGQIASIIRTPALYGAAADAQAYGYKSIVVGTTNRDEGAYIGFFGKASDGMVDLQPIADLHKSEVYEMAKLLSVPESIIKRAPEGDVWDNKTDEEMIGAPYWFLELYETLIDNNLTHLLSKVKDCPDALKWALNIETAHDKNAHKYKVGSPARYVDVIQRTISKK